MSLAPISGTTASAPIQPTDQAKAQAPAPEPVKVAPKKDTVEISKKAVQLASDGDTPEVEAKESAAEKAAENLKGKK
jgi:hypothetical protein